MCIGCNFITHNDIQGSKLKSVGTTGLVQDENTGTRIYGTIHVYVHAQLCCSRWNLMWIILIK